MGVHNGKNVTLTLSPAPAHHGIVFERLDVSEHNSVPALWNHVQVTPLCTQIINAHGVVVRTIEHLMAALYASGIDNARIRLTGDEVPILDGSSTAFLKLIREAGSAPLSAPRRFLKIKKQVEVRDRQSFARFTPASTPSFAITVAYPQHQVLPQSHAFDFETGDFERDVASARTFGFKRDIEALRAHGLTLGGSLDNALLLDEGKVLNQEGTRFDNELARHKLLDAMGDLSLAGAVLRGHFEGHLSGHTLNNALLKALFHDTSAWEDTHVSAPYANV
jgi:UDP-3-O-[3-hydroxymyristoyl] N-acetylglucosamine deacetylase